MRFSGSTRPGSSGPGFGTGSKCPGRRIRLQQRARPVELGYSAGGKLAGLDNDSGRVPMGRYSVDEIELSGPHVDHTDEYDLHLLTRLADRYDAVAKPGNGRLAFAWRDAAMSATLGAVSAVKVAREQAGDYLVTLADRPDCRSVRACWYDTAVGQRVVREQEVCQISTPICHLRRFNPSVTGE